MIVFTEDDIFWAGLMVCRWHLTVRDEAVFQGMLAEHAAMSDIDMFERVPAVEADVFDAAAVLLHGIAFSRPFMFSNMALAWFVTAGFLDLNAVDVPENLDPARAAGVVTRANDGSLDRRQIAQELRELFEGDDTLTARMIKKDEDVW